MIKPSFFFTLFRQRLPDIWIKKIFARLITVLQRETQVLKTIVSTLITLVLTILLLATAMAAILHYWLIPNLTLLEPYIEQNLSKTLKQPVDVKGLTAQWQWNTATVNIDELRIGSEASPQVLAKGINTRIPLYPLLWQHISTHNLKVSELSLSIHQVGKLNQPQWLVAGFDLNQPSDGTSLKWALNQPNILIDTLTLTIHDAAKHWLPEGNTRVSFKQTSLNNTSLQPLNVPLIFKQPHSVTRRFEHIFQTQFAPTSDDPRLGNGIKLLAKFNHGLWADMHTVSLWKGEVDVLMPKVDVKRSAEWILNHYLTAQTQPNTTVDWTAWQKWLKQHKHVSTPKLYTHTHIQFSPHSIAANSTATVNQLPNGLGKSLPFNVQWTWKKLSTSHAATHRIIAKTPGLNVLPWLEQLQKMPIPQPLLNALKTANPQATLKNISIDTAFNNKQVTALSVETSINNASIDTFSWQSNSNQTPVPAVKNISGQIALNYVHDNKSAPYTHAHVKLNSKGVAVTLPNLLAEPTLVLDDIKGDIDLKLKDTALNIAFNNLRFNNADASGVLNGVYQYPLKHSPPHSMGKLNAQGQLMRVNVSSLYRYLPLTLSDSTRAWFKNSFVKGQMNQVAWSINGDLSRFPFISPLSKTEHFKLNGLINDGVLNFNPVSDHSLNQPSWPLIESVTGKIALQGQSLTLEGMKGTLRVAHHLGPTHPVNGVPIQVPRLHINHLNKPVIVAEINTNTSTHNLLDLIRNTPLSTHLGEQFNALHTQGTAEINAHLNLDLANPTTVNMQGTAVLKEVHLNLSPDLPAIEDINATAEFTHSGFNIQTARAKWLGGEVILSGGLDTQDNNKNLHLQGRAYLENIKRYSSNPMAQALLKRTEGALNYDLVLYTNQQGIRWTVTTDLTDTQLKWPGFLDKIVGKPLSFSLARTPIQRNKRTANTPELINHDVWQASLGATVLGPFQGVIERQLKEGNWVIERGAVALGDAAELNTPDTGIGVHITGKSVNLDLIQTELSALPWKTLPINTDNPAQTTSTTPSQPPAWMPSTLAVQVDDLTFGNRIYRNIISGASRSGTYGENWSGNLVAQGINGYFSWKDPHLAKDLGGGQLQLKLTELTIPPSELASSKQSLLNISPNQVPSVELNIDKLTLGTHFLGSVSLQARNTTRPTLTNDERGWDIQMLSIQHPHLNMQAKGVWQHNTQHPQGQVNLDFALNTPNLGNLLNEFQYEQIIAATNGEVTGNIAWQGSPFGIDIASLSGAVKGQFKKGRFLKADPGAGRLVGLFSLQNLPRRLSLDFKDTFGEGFAFDKVNVATTIRKGQLNMDSFVMRSSLAKITAVGKVSLTDEKQALRFTIKPEINAGSASLLYMAINPVVGLSTLAAQWLFKEPLSDSLTVMYDVTGSWAAPEVNPVKRNTALPQTGNFIADNTPFTPAALQTPTDTDVFINLLDTPILPEAF